MGEGWESLFLDKLLNLQFNTGCAVYSKPNHSFKTSDFPFICKRIMLCLSEKPHGNINSITPWILTIFQSNVGKVINN